MIDRILGKTKLLEKALDASWTRNETIAQNIANVDTPGYKRKDVAFKEYLNAALEPGSFEGFRTDKRHIPIGGGSIDDVKMKVTQPNDCFSARLDGNNVDIENEMAQMAKNTIEYNTLIQRLNGKFKGIKSAINEGRK